MSSALVPLVVIKGAAKATLPLPHGENGALGDIHSLNTKTEDPKCYLTSGFYRIVAGKERPAHYKYEESKLVLTGEIDIYDEAIQHLYHCVPGDFIMFPVNSKVKFSTKSEGFAFYVVSRPRNHPHLVGKEEKPVASARL